MPRKHSTSKKLEWVKWGLPHGLDEIIKLLMDGKTIQAHEFAEHALKMHNIYMPFDRTTFEETQEDRDVYGYHKIPKPIKPKSK